MGTLLVEDASEDVLVNLMVGRELTKQYPKEQVKMGEIAMRVENLSVEGALDDISFELRHGEILGLFGLMGSGREELARALFGLEKTTSGVIHLNGNKVRIEEPADAIRHGLGMLTRDRREGLVPMLPVPPNITLAELSQVPLYRKLSLRDELKSAERFVSDLRIQTPSLDRAVMYLSGGNQQKVVLARWLFSQAKILIFDEPTRGIDVGAKSEVFLLMNRLSERGVGILMISSEMPEILAMADRIIVMRNGKFTAEFDSKEATQEKLLRSAS
jgi:ribose transport system ATP-binding protein